jgi:hypothetical protein
MYYRAGIRAELYKYTLRGLLAHWDLPQCDHDLAVPNNKMPLRPEPPGEIAQNIPNLIARLLSAKLF